MKKINIGLNLTIIINKSADKFFKKHNHVYSKFLKNVESFYIDDNANVDIVAMKNYKGIFRMRINDYRVIYRLENGEIIIIEVLLVKSRGEVYKNFK